MTLTNSDTVPRSAQIVRIVGDHSVDEVVKVVLGDDMKIPDWLQDGGGVPAVKSGASASATQVLAPVATRSSTTTTTWATTRRPTPSSVPRAVHRHRRAISGAPARAAGDDHRQRRQAGQQDDLRVPAGGTEGRHEPGAFPEHGREAAPRAVRAAAQGRNARSGQEAVLVGPSAGWHAHGRLREDRRNEGHRRGHRAERHARARGRRATRSSASSATARAASRTSPRA